MAKFRPLVERADNERGDDEKVLSMDSLAPGRRGFLRAVSGAAPGLLLAGCTGDGGQDTTTTTTADTTTADSDTTQTTESDSGDGGEPTRITAAAPVAVESLDPHNTNIGQVAGVRNLVFDDLIWRDGQGNLQPSVAADFPEVSEDGLEYVFELQQGISFHSGSSLTAHDVEYSWNWFLNEDNGAVLASRFKPYLQNVTAEGDYTVRFELSEPWSPWTGFEYEYSGIIEENSREEYDDFTFPNGPGSGPGIPEDYNPQSHWTFSGNDDYWHDEIPRWDEYRVEVVTNPTQRALRLQEGEIDLEPAHSPQDHQELQNTEGVEVDSVPQILGSVGMYVKCQYRAGREGETSPFENIHNRKAIQYAIPRQQIAEELYDGLLTPTSAWCSPESWLYSEEIDQYEYNPDMVQQQLEEAGNPDGFDVRLLTMQQSPVVDIATLLQSQLSQYGINVEINRVTRGTGYQTMPEDSWDLGLLTIQLPPDPDYAASIWFAEWGAYAYQKGAWLNWMPLHPEEADRATELVEQGRRVADRDERAEIYQELGAIINDVSPIIYVGSIHSLMGYRNNVTNVSATVDNTPRHKIYGKE